MVFDLAMDLCLTQIEALQPLKSLGRISRRHNFELTPNAKSSYNAPYGDPFSGALVLHQSLSQLSLVGAEIQQ